MNHFIKKKLILGTANFNSLYGLRKIKSKNNYSILEYAKQKKINWIDTSGAYLNSEKTIGKKKNLFKIITKNHFNFKKSITDKELRKKIKKIINKSFTNLKKKTIYGFLIQNSKTLLSKNGDQIYKTLLEYKRNGKIKKIGISTYNFQELREIIKKFKIDLVQVPFNIINDELYSSGMLRILKKNNIEVHVRSIFLQGILLLNFDQLPNKLSGLKKYWKILENILKKKNITSLQACLKYVLSFKNIDKIVIGVEDKKQLEKILKTNINFPKFAKPKIKIKNKNLINPVYWSKHL